MGKKDKTSALSEATDAPNKKPPSKTKLKTASAVHKSKATDDAWLETLMKKSKEKSAKEPLTEKPKKPTKEGNSWLDISSKPSSVDKKERRYTEEGFPIYEASELLSTTGGDTPECPFDCDCCY